MDASGATGVGTDRPADGRDPAKPSLQLRRKRDGRAPLVRLSWPSQPALGTLDFDDTEAI